MKNNNKILWDLMAYSIVVYIPPAIVLIALLANKWGFWAFTIVNYVIFVQSYYSTFKKGNK